MAIGARDSGIFSAQFRWGTKARALACPSPLAGHQWRLAEPSGEQPCFIGQVLLRLGQACLKRDERTRRSRPACSSEVFAQFGQLPDKIAPFRRSREESAPQRERWSWQHTPVAIGVESPAMSMRADRPSPCCGAIMRLQHSARRRWSCKATLLRQKNLQPRHKPSADHGARGLGVLLMPRHRPHRDFHDGARLLRLRGCGPKGARGFSSVLHSKGMLHPGANCWK